MNVRLEFTFIPASCRGHNLHELLPQVQWDAIRRQVYRQAGYRCEACGAAGVLLQANEQWEYDDKLHIQRLVGLTCLCEGCHAVAHTNWAGADGSTQAKLSQRFCRVNGCTETMYGRLRSEAMARWQERSRQGPWITNFGPYTSLVAAWEARQQGQHTAASSAAREETTA